MHGEMAELAGHDQKAKRADLTALPGLSGLLALGEWTPGRRAGLEGVDRWFLRVPPLAGDDRNSSG